ncbi:unnamed protein product [Closterium sp. NIES-54]
MLGSAHPAHRAVVLRRPATSAVLSAVLARGPLPPPSAPVARSPSAPHAAPPCAPPSQFAHRPPPLARGDRGGAGGDVCRGFPRPRLPLRSVIREGWFLPAAWRAGSESGWRGLVVGARVAERVAESSGAGARAAVMGESRGEGEERWRGEGAAVGGAEREVGGEGGASEQVVFDPPALPAAFEGVQRWVVFSDLHVSRRNADLCAALLTHVHQLAKDRAAGVVCLGDFWHVRGSLPVEALNAVMQAMGPAAWTQPTIMIPGNHDQVSVDGTQHALAVLARINPHIVVLSHPTMLLAALWLPFRHHAPLLSAAMHQALHAPPPAAPPIRAVFMHADVEGARRSSVEGAITLPGEGLDPLLLPAGLPVYSGHLHLPHTVAKGGRSVHYVGSCMQHSFGEAGQSKRAVVLRGDTWEHVEDIPLDVGPRHFIIPASASASQPGEGEGESEWQAGKGWQQVVPLLRAGDLVRWEVPGGADAKETREALVCLRGTGALVQTVASRALSRPPRILQADTLEPSRVFASYATAAHLPPPVLSAAQVLLKDLDVPPRLMHSTSAHVCLDAVHLSGFGPFLAPTSYPLASRGIVLLCGRNEVAGGAAGDSNGAGKTSLAMAALWALTGSMDARPDSRQGLRMADVVHRSGQGEGSEGGAGEGGTEGKGRGRRRRGEGGGGGVARVRVEGRVNGKAFVIEREASSRRSALRLEVEGQEQTCQEIRLTQDRIDALMDTSLLSRTVFFGQHSTAALLEANDADFKAPAPPSPFSPSISFTPLISNFHCVIFSSSCLFSLPPFCASLSPRSPLPLHASSPPAAICPCPFKMTPPSFSPAPVHVPPPAPLNPLPRPTELSHSFSPASFLLHLSISPLSPLPAPRSCTPAHPSGGAEWGGGHGRVGGGQGAQQGGREGAAGARGGDERRTAGTQGGRQEAGAHGGRSRGCLQHLGREQVSHAIPCHVIPCHPMPCHPMPCHAMPCTCFSVTAHFHHFNPHALAVTCGMIQCVPAPSLTHLPHPRTALISPHPTLSPTTRAVRQQRVGQQQQGAEQQLASACQRLASLVAPRLQAAVALSHSHALALHSSVLASLSGGEGEGERGTRMGGVGGGRAGRGEEEEGMEERERALMTGIASLQGEVGAREEGVDVWVSFPSLCWYAPFPLQLSAVTAGLREQQQRLGEFEAHVGGAVGGGEVLVCDRCQQPIDPLHAEECSRQLRAEVEETQRQLAGKQQAQEELRGELGGVRGWLEARRRERWESEERDVQARRQQQQAAMAQQEERATHPALPAPHALPCQRAPRPALPAPRAPALPRAYHQLPLPPAHTPSVATATAPTTTATTPTVPATDTAESLSPQQLREWAIWWGSPGGGASRARRRKPLSPLQRREWTVRWGATIGGTCESTLAGSAASRRGGSGGGQQRPLETLSPQQLREWAIRWGSPGGGGFRGTRTGGVEATSLRACDSASAEAEPDEALHTFTLDSGASRCFFRDSTTVTPLTVLVPVTLADPSGGPVVARGATVLPCPAAPSGFLTGLHLPSFAKNLVATSVLQDQPGSGLYTLTTESALVAESGQVAASVEVASYCSCCLLTHQTLLWHHRLGHPSLPRLRGMHSRLLVPGLPRSLLPLPRSLAPPCLPCVEGRQRAAPHSSSFPPTTSPLHTLHMDVWGPARVTRQGGERYFLLVVHDYTRYTTIFPLQSKADDRGVLIR